MVETSGPPVQNGTIPEWMSTLAGPPRDPDAPIVRNLAVPCAPHYWQIESNHAKLVTHAVCVKCGATKDFPAIFQFRQGVRPVEAEVKKSKAAGEVPWVDTSRRGEPDRLGKGAKKAARMNRWLRAER